uniref:5-formyltetrahydrofolate cyclo-ligase n=1 Tax=Alistipes sp. TaxID=1872444 RepID=UPI004055E6A1
MESKQEIRRRMRQLNRAMEPAARAKASVHIMEQIEALEAFIQAKTIALFVSLADEPDTTEWLRRWSLSKQLLIPRVEGEVMHFYAYRPEMMAIGSFGINEPQQAEQISPKEIDLMIIPGVAFTPEGVRCGRGKGYYDKYLPALREEVIKVGVCYHHQLAEELPHEVHDICMDLVIEGK